jgi:hypothetical protein
MKMKVRKFLCVLLVLMLALGLTACGSSAKSEAADMYYNAEMEMAPAEKPASGLVTDSSSENGSAASLPSDRKLIRNIHMEAETEDLTALTDALTSRIAALGGYVESKNLRNGSAYSGYYRRTLSMTVRIPAEKADEFVAQVSETSNIVSSSENIDDVTLQYVDTESHVKALETEQERLLALLEKAESLKDIITLEERLTSVRYELERYASYLRTLDNQVTYATIHLSVTEVKEYTPVQVEEPTVWQRIATGFGRTMKNIRRDLADLFVWVVVNSPYLLIWGIVITLVVIFLRRKGLRPRRRKSPPPKEPTE